MELDLGDDWQEIDVDERRQRLLKARRDDDDLPTGITVRQAAHIANLIGAAADGHAMREAMVDVERFLTLASLAKVAGAAHVRVSGASNLDDAWAKVERWPVPPPGPPRGQPT